MKFILEGRRESKDPELTQSAYILATIRQFSDAWRLITINSDLGSWIDYKFYTVKDRRGNHGWREHDKNATMLRKNHFRNEFKKFEIFLLENAKENIKL